MASAMDALQSFVHLNDTVPLWLSKLDELTLSVAEHNARFLEMARLGDRLFKQKNLSTESLHQGPLHHYAIDDGGKAAKESDVYVPPNPSHQVLSHASRAWNAANNGGIVRKRKGSNASITSGQHRYRTKSMIVVYYDSAVQESLDSLFRSIASARNNLRKGKTDASFKARMASLGTEQSSYPAAGDFAMLNPKLMRAGLGRRPLGPDLRADEKLSAFDEADKDLEITQTLCEVAAHQFLREGDCRLEIEGMRRKFENCRAIAKREVDRLKEEEAREQEEEEVAAKPVQGKQLLVAKSVEAKVSHPPPLKEVNFTGTGVIEIDDGSDVESAPIDLSAFRSRTRRV
ncbi:hypothetical protein IMSHALPRED_007186 [Imshaugia aleurites]|uniref:Uncharacterized protein n=1 Tax=Imshaugia aleurites TaxID=172621 RepID=A0A8H3FJX3_9LECA|nr:hypothetical protein IMSHALPRED_007186 [Imshaugia aleurites]